jgi:hypothetical protein
MPKPKLTYKPTPKPKPTTPTVLQLRIDLEEVDPAIWRRLLVPSGIRLAKLHDIFQVAMGWTDSHLHAFTIGDRRYGMHIDDFLDNELDEKKFTVLKALGDERRFRYEYDFGDDWQHHVLVEDIIKVPAELPFAVCLDGQRSCPPEDCGGPYGYANLLNAIEDPGHEEHDEYIEWVGDDFDPEEFNLATTNVILQHLG